MHCQSNNSSLDPTIGLQYRIKEIRAKVVALSHKFKSKTRDYNEKNNITKKERKYDFFDEDEVLAVERCHAKALRLAEHSLKIKSARKVCGLKLNPIHDFSGSNKHKFSTGSCVTRCSQTISTKRKQLHNSKSIPLISEKGFSSKFSNFVEKQNTLEQINESFSNKNEVEIITILDEDDNAPFCQSKKNSSWKQKSQKNSVVKKAVVSPSLIDEQFKPMVVYENHVFNSLEKASTQLSKEQYTNKIEENNLHHKKLKQDKDFSLKERHKEQPPKNIDANKKLRSEGALSPHKLIKKNCKNLENFDNDVVYLKTSNCSDVTWKKKKPLFNRNAGEKRNKNSKTNQNNTHCNQEIFEVDQNSDIVCLEDGNTIAISSETSLEKFKTGIFENGAETTKKFINDYASSAENLIEKIIPKLDLTEEPVDFPIPFLHRDESLTVSEEKIKSLKSKGIVIKGGTFSDEEHAFLKRNFKEFQTQFGINDASLLLGIGRRLPFNKHAFKKIKKFLQAKHFYVRLGRDINQRTLKMIYYRARLLFSPFRRRKKDVNEIGHVFQLQKKYGNNWSLIGHMLNLDPLDCRNIYRYRKHLVN